MTALDGRRVPFDSTDPNSTGRVAVIVLFSAVVAMLLLMAPAAASQLQLQLALSPSQTGDLFAAELGAMSIASIPALWWIKKYNLRTMSTIFGTIFIVGNICSAYIGEYGTLVAVRFLTSLAGGSLMVLCMALAAQTRDRNRVYGLWLMGQLCFGAIGLAVLPKFFDTFGIGIVYWVLAILMIVVLPLVRFLPQRNIFAGRPADEDAVPTANYALRATLGLIALLAFYVSLSGIWTFLGSIAGASMIDNDTSSSILSIATVFGIAGSVGATVLGARPNTRINLLVGYLAMTLSVALLAGTPGVLRFTAAALLFKFTWTFILPYLMSTLSGLDRSGQLVNLANLAIGGGFALGPLMGGRLVESAGGCGTLVAVSVAGLLLSLVLILVAQPRRTAVPSSPVAVSHLAE
ncbi:MULTISPECIES: MFS transporter [unclassified Rhodococcus (in: high G+C Gram-positive bacteria)]|uniref:MFS transporter n=1 Tax=unclassified Rhodococcus (in: high G+C Gram-positive bacteria) TaxID=192944 RepID=UPI0016394DFB|nr:MULTISPECIES: MFS transporter [unclassified Rhodococcus (in: high G+C Gram-positive bacteria)]MBC2639174.1 MFS transporter [Rhodococcus sp. 3A]MBC2896083.1 MFS transporter [Rhodococcus sp. 4CII]